MNRNDHKHKQLLIQLQDNRQSLESRIIDMYTDITDEDHAWKILELCKAYEEQTSLDEMFFYLWNNPDYLRELRWLTRIQYNKYQFEYMSNTTLKRWTYSNKAFNHFITFARKHLKMSLVDTFKFLCLINK